MKIYELTNEQRRYFGLTPVDINWDKVLVNEKVTLYYEGNRIVKILKYNLGYFEYDTDIKTRDRQILIPMTARGKEQNLTIPRILKIKGSGISFSGSFQGGRIHVYDNRRNLFFIKSFDEDGAIDSYQDIENWISRYISNLPADYFKWLNNQLTQQRLKVKIKEGDIIAYKIAQGQYAFARVLADVFANLKKGLKQGLAGFHPRSLIVAPYAYYADTLEIDLDDLLNKPTLPTLCIFDIEVYRGEMPVVGHWPLSLKDKQILFPEKAETCITIPYTKTDIERFIADNGLSNLGSIISITPTQNPGFP